MSVALKPTELRDTGIDVLGRMPWSTHVSVFYETPADALDVVVPFLKAGLEAGERCVWIPPDPAGREHGERALRRALSDYDGHVARRDILIVSAQEFYPPEEPFDVDVLVNRWLDLADRARKDGYAGLRGIEDETWFEALEWRAVCAFEEAFHVGVRARRILFMCAYPLTQRSASNLLDSARAHDLVLARRRGSWDTLETPVLRETKAEIQRRSNDLEKRVAERTKELERSWAYLVEAQRLSHTGSFAVDAATRELTFWSPEQFRMFGFEPGDEPPPMETFLSSLHPADRSKQVRVIADVIAERRDIGVELRHVRPDGSVRYIHKIHHPVVDESGNVVEVVGSDIDLTERKLAAARLARAKRVARERALEERFAAALDERTRLAREIHDTLLQGVTGIALQLRALLPRLRGAPTRVLDSLRGVVELAETTIREARQAVWDMRSPLLMQKGLPGALDEVARLAETDGKARFTIRGQPNALARDVEDTIFRVGQEALINAVKHAEPRHIDVSLDYGEKAVRLTVTDDGRGFQVARHVGAYAGRWGVLGMRERAERIGATLRIRSAPGRGTTVSLRVPVKSSSRKR